MHGRRRAIRQKRRNRRQKAESREQKKLRRRELSRIGHHTSQHSSYFLVPWCQAISILLRQVTAIKGKVDPNLSLGCLSIAISEFAQKVIWISAFPKSLSNVCCHAARRPSYLIRQ